MRARTLRGGAPGPPGRERERARARNAHRETETERVGEGERQEIESVGGSDERGSGTPYTLDTLHHAVILGGGAVSYERGTPVQVRKVAGGPAAGYRDGRTDAVYPYII